MTPGLIAAALFGSFTLALLLGCPIMAALGAASMLCFMLQGLDLSIMLERAFASLTIFPLMALPAFVLAGALMEACGISKRLVQIAEALVGKTSGGIAMATVLACVLFGAVSGSGPATTAAVGMLMIPAMTSHGYKPATAAAITASAGGLGIIIPPSIAMIVYGVSGQVSISRMFMAGIIPGCLLATGLCVMLFFTAPAFYSPQNAPLSLFAAVREGFWALLAPIIVLGGIYAGFFTPTEAAVVTIFYTLLVGILIYRELSWKKILLALNATAWLTGKVLLLVFTASVFGFVLTLNNIPQQLAEYMLFLTDSLFLVWVLVIAILLILGMFMETLALIMLVTPVLLPVMEAYGVDPVHFGTVMICCCALGFATPPLGENLFIASGICGESLERISVNALPLLVICLVAIAFIAAFPELCLWLPDLMRP